MKLIRRDGHDPSLPLPWRAKLQQQQNVKLHKLGGVIGGSENPVEAACKLRKLPAFSCAPLQAVVLVSTWLWELEVS
jgi:hypothetical protein